MNKVFSIFACALFLSTSCQNIDGLLGSIAGASSPSESEVASGLIESLAIGMTHGSELVSKLDGFYKNPLIAIPFPPEAEKIKSTLIKVGASKLVDQTTLSLNRAAEKASYEAKDVLITAIQQMTITDAMKILFGPTNAATLFLKQTTTNTLLNKFEPIIASSLSSVHATQYWSEVMGTYNKYNVMGVLGKPVNTNLTQFVASKALDGLFTMVEKEELNIRSNPISRTTALLQKVFGFADSKKP